MTSFNTYANTSWKDGVSTVLGQIAEQTFSITFPFIDEDGSNIGKLIDELATVNGIVINGLSFDLKDKTELFDNARKQAFGNAFEKAKDYTEALGLSLGSVLNIRDSFSRAPVVGDSIRSDESLKMAGGNSATEVNVGTIEASYDMSAIFSFSL